MTKVVKLVAVPPTRTLPICPVAGAALRDDVSAARVVDVVGVVWFGNCDGTSPAVVLPVIVLAWNRFKPAGDKEGRVILERRGATWSVLACRVAVDRVDDDAGPQNDGQTQIDLELVVLIVLVERRSPGGRVVDVHAAETKRVHPSGM